MTPEWRAGGGQCIVVRETLGSHPGGTSIFGPLPFRGDSLQTKNPLRELGLNKYIWIVEHK